MAADLSQLWSIWQLVDSAFPTGGFAHSAGLEASKQAGQIRSEEDLLEFCESFLIQTVYGSLPYVVAVHGDRDSVWEADLHCDAFLSSPVANRASRTQGNGLLVAAGNAFPDSPISELRKRARADKSPTHLAPMFGLVFGILDKPLQITRESFVYVSLRGVLSAAIRLNIVGPLRCQHLQQQLAPFAEDLLNREGLPATWHQAVQASPMLEVWQAAHDRLYSRLFQS